jgi:hypothetical protein
MDSTEAFFFEKYSSTKKRDAVHQILERCKVLAQKQWVHSTIAMDSAGFHYTDN